MLAYELPELDITRVFDKTSAMGRLLEFLIYTAIAAIVTAIVLSVYNRFVKKKLRDNKNIQVRFTQNLIRAIIILIAVIWVLVSSSATTNIGKVLFQGTAIIGAVVGLAAQPVIGDLFSGITLSINRPFEIGDRIELEDGVRGIVTDITMRHVVIRTIDTVDVIVPNSKINASMITNMSHNTKIRSVHMRFKVAFGTNIERAMQAVKKAVVYSEYTIPAWQGKPQYGPVYFISYADSSLVLSTTVYYQPTVATDVVISDINTRVHDIFMEEGIEIPYSYVNVVMKDQGAEEEK